MNGAAALPIAPVVACSLPHPVDVARLKYLTYKVRLPANTERGRYDLSHPVATRTWSTGFVLPSNNEWVKAAYYDPMKTGPATLVIAPVITLGENLSTQRATLLSER